MEIIIKINNREIVAERGEKLSDVLIRNGFSQSHPCGGKGICQKCRALVNGKPVMSCQYALCEDVTVELESEGDILSEVGVVISQSASATDLVLDLGTTTLALALIDKNTKSVVKVITASNPQRRFGADVISRIEYCQKNGVALLTDLIRSEVRRMIAEIGEQCLDTLYVAGNTVMLHIFAGADPSSMGAAPYVPSFLGEIVRSAECYGISGVKSIHLLPSISAFIGADIVAGINYVGLPTDKYRLMIDLGTNAEIALFSKDKIITTSAAAGPCFEGACISSGMSATDGAIYHYDGVSTKTVNNSPARGICATGLVDIIAVLLKRAKIDGSGQLDEDEFEISAGVAITQEDIRQYQLAKSAIYSAVITIMERSGINFSDIEALYISGGFSAKMNAQNAAYTGLIPTELSDRCYSIGNSSLFGAIQSVFENSELSDITSKASYVDLSRDTVFADLFIKNMRFNK